MQIKSLGMASEIQVYDNFLSKNELNEINSSLFSDKSVFNWYFSRSKMRDGVKEDGITQFIHFLYVDNQIVSDFFGLFSNTIFNKLNILSFIRVKLNLQIRDSIIRKSQLHRDVEVISQEQKTGIFYLNSNDGYTFFENGEKIKSVENRMVIFPSSLYHAGTTHTDAQYRCVVNMNWI